MTHIDFFCTSQGLIDRLQVGWGGELSVHIREIGFGTWWQSKFPNYLIWECSSKTAKAVLENSSLLHSFLFQTFRPLTSYMMQFFPLDNIDKTMLTDRAVFSVWGWVVALLLLYLWTLSRILWPLTLVMTPPTFSYSPKCSLNNSLVCTHVYFAHPTHGMCWLFNNYYWGHANGLWGNISEGNCLKLKLKYINMP